MYKISVVIPVYNVEQYIEESIKSICNQKFDNFQIILVNDGTKDNSITKAVNVLKTNKSDYKIINQENLGLPAARNTGLRNSDGEYVIFIDSDDIIEEDLLDTLYKACVNTHAMAAFCDYQITHIDNRNGVSALGGKTVVINRDDLLLANMCRTIKIHLCSILLNKEFLLKNNLWFNESLRFGEEVDYTWRLYPILSEIAYIRSAKYKYLVRENSLMTSQNVDRVIYLMDVMHREIEKWFNSNPNDAQHYKWVEQKIYIEKLHAFSEYSDYGTFLRLINNTNYRERMSQLSDFPDLKICLLAQILKFMPRLFWGIFQVKKI